MVKNLDACSLERLAQKVQRVATNETAFLRQSIGATLILKSKSLQIGVGLRTCSRSPEQQNQESQVDELHAGVEQPLAVLPQPPILV